MMFTFCKIMKAVLLIVTIQEILPSLVHALDLPINIILHLDKRYPNYLETLQPWNYLTVPVEANLSTLTYVIGVFRHGNKPPTDTYEGDKYPFYDKRFWPNGYSQVTKVGKQQMYTLGRKLRKRYDGYLSRVYQNNEIIVKGNPLDRIYVSAACLLAGLYPPVRTNSEAEWQPVPIWEQHHDMSKIAKDPKECPRFYEMELEIEEIINKYTYQYQDLIDFLNNSTGLGVTQLRDLFVYWNLVYFQEHEGYGIPEWADNGRMEVLTNLASSSFTGLLSSNQEMQKLIAGPLVKDFANELLTKIVGRDKEMLYRKMHLEGGHGTTLNGLLPAIGFKEPFVPHLASVFLLELHTSLKGAYIQALYLTNSSNEEVELMEIPDCGFECPLNQMLERMAKVTPTNWQEECEISGYRTALVSTTRFIMCYMLCIMIILFNY